MTRRPFAAVLAVALATTFVVLARPAGADTIAFLPLSADSAAPTGVPLTFTLDIDVPGATSAKLYVDGAWRGTDSVAPLAFPVTLTAGAHELQVRPTPDGGTPRIYRWVVAEAGAPPTTEPGATTTSVIEPTTTLPPPACPLDVDTVAELWDALGCAAPGDVIRVADGTYNADGLTPKPPSGRLEARASGTAAAPITLTGSRAAVLSGDTPGGQYGLWVLGDHWRIEGLTVAHAAKGIVLDGSVGTVIDGVEVFDIGAEAVHFRSCSSDGVLRNSHIHDTGVNQAGFGEGAYVGSANSNWPGFACVDTTEGTDPGRDNTERVLIEGNLFEDIAAEGVDLKEGTDSGTVRANTFRRVGTSGANSADSAVDAKGNGWLIERNTVLEPVGAMRDGFQSHDVYSGYGTGNVFRGNSVIGSVPGFGIGMYPEAGNVVECSNVAHGAALGLVGANSQPTTCTEG